MVQKQNPAVGALTLVMPLLRWLGAKGMSWTEKNGIEALYFASSCPVGSTRRDIIYQSNHGDRLVNELPFGTSEAEGDQLANLAFDQCKALVCPWSPARG